MSETQEDKYVRVKATNVKGHQECVGFRGHQLQAETEWNPSLRLHHCAVRLYECVKIIGANEFGAKSHF